MFRKIILALDVLAVLVLTGTLAQGIIDLYAQHDPLALPLLIGGALLLFALLPALLAADAIYLWRRGESAPRTMLRKALPWLNVVMILLLALPPLLFVILGTSEGDQTTISLLDSTPAPAASAPPVPSPPLGEKHAVYEIATVGGSDGPMVLFSSVSITTGAIAFILLFLLLLGCNAWLLRASKPASPAE